MAKVLGAISLAPHTYASLRKHTLGTKHRKVVVMYEVSDYYAPRYESRIRWSRIRWNAPDIAFPWALKGASPFAIYSRGQRFRTSDNGNTRRLHEGFGPSHGAHGQAFLGHTDHEVLVVDKLTYADNLASLAFVQGELRYQLP